MLCDLGRDVEIIFITKTIPCNIQRFFMAVKNEFFLDEKKMTIFLFLLKTYIVGTRWNCLIEAVLTSTHNLYFKTKIRNYVYHCKP